MEKCNTYTLTLTGKQMVMLMNCIDERVNSNTIIGSRTGTSKGSENRSLRSLQRYIKNIKTSGQTNGTPL